MKRNLRRTKAIKFLLVAFVFVLTIASTRTLFAASKQVEIILDCSRSMLETIEGQQKLDIAKKALTSVLNDIPQDFEVGFRAFAFSPPRGNIKDSCRDSKLLYSIQRGNRQALLNQVMSLKAMGPTPVGYSLLEASKDFSPDAEKMIILVSDGAETCGVDPVGVVNKLKSQGINLQIFTIGFDVDAAAAAQLRTIAETSGGSYLSASTPAQLVQTVSQTISQTVSTGTNQVAFGDVGHVGRAKPKPVEIDLASPKNGGAVVITTNPSLTVIFKSDKHYANSQVDEEIVLQFQEGKIAEINRVAVPIFETTNRNLKEFEILVSMDSPTEGFSSIGVFETKNVAYVGKPFQEFVFEPTKVRYLKLIPRSFWNNSWGHLRPLRVFGKISEDQTEVKSGPVTFTSSAIKQEEKKGPINLAEKSNGGMIITAPDATFERLIDGEERGLYTYVEQEVVVAFKDKSLATISKVSLPIFKTSPRNIKRFEIQVSEESPTEGFTSVGTFEMKNIAFLQNPYQEFTFDPIKARYVKFIVRDESTGTRRDYFELRIIGELEG